MNNSSAGQTIAKNTAWLFLGQIMSRLFRAVIVIWSARILGASSWGAFAYALGIAAFLTTFSDIGVNALITKEAARNPELKNQYLATALFIKLTLVAALIALIIIFFPYLTKIDEAARLMPIVIFVFAFDSLRELGGAVARALQKMEIEALIQIFTNFSIMVLGLVFLALQPGSRSLAFAYALGSGLGLAAIIFSLKSHFQNLLQNFRKNLIGKIMATAWPFGLLGIMGVLMLNTDIIMLGWLRTPEEVGFYAAAQKIIQLLYVLPTLLAVSIFPVISRLAPAEPANAKKLLEKSVALVILIALPIAVIGISLAAFIVNVFFGNAYLAAIPAFQILMLSVLIVYPSSLIGHAIFAYDAQKHFVAFVAVSAVGNVIMNLILIPPFGIEGAAASTIIVQLLVNFLIWRKMKRLNGFTIWPELKSRLRAIASGLKSNL